MVNKKLLRKVEGKNYDRRAPYSRKGFFAALTPAQQAAALAYRGDENHGDPDFPKEQIKSERLKGYRGILGSMTTEQIRDIGNMPMGPEQEVGYVGESLEQTGAADRRDRS